MVSPIRKSFFSLPKTLSLSVAFLTAFSLFFYFFSYKPYRAEKASALWRIVSHHCAKTPSHKPCLAYHPDKDYVLLKDLVGKAQVLLIPISRVSGVESSVLGQKETPNYFQSAWEERAILSRMLHRTISDQNISLSVNSRFARSQNQLHLHISCLKKNVAETLHELNPADLPPVITLEGNPYKIHLANSLEHSPFLKINRAENFNPEKTGKKTILVAQAPHGQFYILTGETDLWHLNWGESESLQDHNCTQAAVP